MTKNNNKNLKEDTNLIPDDELNISGGSFSEKLKKAYQVEVESVSCFRCGNKYKKSPLVVGSKCPKCGYSSSLAPDYQPKWSGETTQDWQKHTNPLND